MEKCHTGWFLKPRLYGKLVVKIRSEGTKTAGAFAIKGLNRPRGDVRTRSVRWLFPKECREHYKYASSAIVGVWLEGVQTIAHARCTADADRRWAGCRAKSGGARATGAVVVAWLVLNRAVAGNGQGDLSCYPWLPGQGRRRAGGSRRRCRGNDTTSQAKL